MTAHQHQQREGSLYALAMFVSGTFSTVIMKTEYGVRAEGTETCVDPADPRALTMLCPFDKPWFGVLQMKLAMALVLVFLYVRKAVTHADYLATPLLRLRKDGKRYMNTPEAAAINKRHGGGGNGARRGHEAQSLLPRTGLPAPPAAEAASVPLKTMAAVALPAVLDLLQTVLANVGLLWISSSVFQMARGSVIIFSAVFSVRLMGKRLYGYHYMSIFIVAVSVALVGWAGVGHGGSGSGGGEGGATDPAAESEAWNALLGLGFIVAAQVLTALQIVVEEHMMIALNVSPMLLVGLEGLWGLVFYVVLVPVLTLSPAGASGFSKIWHEDFADSFTKVGNSPTLVALILAYIVAVGTLNVAGNYVTKHLSAVMRSITETLRTLGVWMLSLFVYYVLKWQGPHSAGEPWTVYSWLELLGFVLMVYGTLAYKKLISIPLRALYAAEQREHAAAYKSPYMSTLHK
ncbi:hypothetical protein PybrP1_006034 [[Pythium] brassicae (nom. inval.)]|nr:hypothetical protein PybrP1_006034 [[Pythium] brassicae (nom. inval.)]